VPPATEGSYVAVPLGQRYQRPATPSKLLADLAPGLVSAHADLEQVVAAFGPMIGVSLSAFETTMAKEFEQAGSGLDGEATAELYVRLARSVLSSVGSMSMQLGYEGGHLRASVAVVARPGSDLDGWSSPKPIDVAEVAGQLRRDSSIAIVGGWDIDHLFAKFTPFMDDLLAIYPPALRDVLAPMFADYKQVYELFGSVYAADGDLFGEAGMSLRMHARPDDIDQFTAGYAKLMKETPFATLGIELSDGKHSEQDGAVIDEYLVTLNLETLAALSGKADSPDNADLKQALAMFLGESGRVPLRFASKGNRGMIDIGAQATAAAPDFGAGRTPPPAVTAALARLQGCNPLFVEHFDMARMMSAVAAHLGARAPADAAAEMTLGFGVEGREWRMVFSMDLAGMARTMSQMRPR
jgi:hypothetical protein